MTWTGGPFYLKRIAWYWFCEGTTIPKMDEEGHLTFFSRTRYCRFPINAGLQAFNPIRALSSTRCRAAIDAGSTAALTGTTLLPAPLGRSTAGNHCSRARGRPALVFADSASLTGGSAYRSSRPTTPSTAQQPDQKTSFSICKKRTDSFRRGYLCFL